MNIIELKRIVDSIYERTEEYNRESTTVGIEAAKNGLQQCLENTVILWKKECVK